MKQRAALAIVALALAGLGLGFWQWSLSRPTVERFVLSALRHATGLSVTAADESHLSFLPKPGISLSDATFFSADGTVRAQAARMRGEVKLLPLLLGRIEIDTIELDAPQFEVALPGERSALSDTQFLIGEVIGRPRALPRVVVRQGSLFVRDGRAIVSTVRDINMLFAARSAGEPLIAAGGLRWRGEDTNVTLQWPVGAMSGPAQLRVRAESLNLRYDGERKAADSGRIEGQLELDTPSLARAFAWLGESSALSIAAERMRLSGSLNWTGTDFVATGATLSLDGDRLDGSLTLRPAAGGSRWELVGTLAGAQFDLDRVLARSGIARHFDRGNHARTPIDLDALSLRDIDLRLSLDKAQLAQAALSDLALQVMVSRGRLDVNLVRATGYKGTVKARVTLAQSAPSRAIDLKVTGGMDKLDLGAASAALGDNRRFSGMAYGQVAAEGSGPDLAGAVGNLAGKASLLIRQGEIGGVALADLARRFERQPLTALRDWRGGRTSFDLANFAGPINQGVIELSDGQVSGQGYRLVMAGRLFLADRTMALSGALTGATGSVLVPFDVKGAWSDPTIAADTEGLIRRSGAAAPLFQR